MSGLAVVPQPHLPEVLLIEPRVFGDARGYFLETWSERSFPELLDADEQPIRFVQDNLSFSRRGILRGLHLQNPHGQGKLVMVITGTVFDVAVDVRQGSPSFGRWAGVELSADNHRQFYVPPGFAHGFCVLSETAHFLYKCTDYYFPQDELSIHYADPELAIDWPTESPTLSDKDRAAPRLRELAAERLPTWRPR